jgi:2,3-bisphosphoglycerate-dependent phosphoglycerate mutase
VNNYLILVKHSLPEIVKEIPAREWHLSNHGLLRAKRLADRLTAYQPGILISSVEPKARETAEIIGTLHELPVEVVEDLHEHDRSGTRYLSNDEFQSAVREFFLNPDGLVFGKETADEAHRRFSKAVESILESHGNKTVVIVSHGTVISLFVSRLTGISDYLLWNQLGLPGFIVLDITSNKLIAQENIL